MFKIISQLMSKMIIEFQNDIKKNFKDFETKLTNNVRFLTFNVHFWKNFNNKNKYEEIVELIKESNADVVGLQEAMLFDKTIQNKYKKDFEKIGYQYQIVANEKHGINILLSKYPIIDFKILKLKQDPIRKLNRYAIFATIDIVCKFNVVVTHLDVYDESEETRLNQIQTIIGELSKLPNLETIMMGDFNSLRRNDYTNDHWNAIMKHDLKRNVIPMTLVSDYLEKQQYFTNDLNMSVWSMRRVDYIYTKNMKSKTTLFSSYPSDLSDHYPVYLDLLCKPK